MLKYLPWGRLLLLTPDEEVECLSPLLFVPKRLVSLLRGPFVPLTLWMNMTDWRQVRRLSPHRFSSPYPRQFTLEPSVPLTPKYVGRHTGRSAFYQSTTGPLVLPLIPRVHSHSHARHITRLWHVVWKAKNQLPILAAT